MSQPDRSNRQVSLDEWEDIVFKRYGVPDNLRRAMMEQESGGDVNAVSPTGVRGRYQVTEATAKMYGLDRNDPYQQAVAAAKHLKSRYDSLGEIKNENARWLGAVGRYYGGDDAVDQTGNLSRKSPDGVSTPDVHVERVARKWGEFNRLGGASASAPPSAPASTPRDLSPIDKPANRPVRPQALAGNEDRYRRAADLIRGIEGAKREAVELFRAADRPTNRATSPDSAGAPVSQSAALRAQAEGRLEYANQLADAAARDYGDLIETGFGEDVDKTSNRRWAYAKPKQGFVEYFRSPGVDRRAAATRPEDIAATTRQQRRIQEERARFNQRSMVGRQAEKLFTRFAGGDLGATPEAQEDLAIRRAALGMGEPETPTGLSEAAGQFGRAALSGMARIPRGLALLPQTIGGLTTGQAPPLEDPLTRAGAAFSDPAERAAAALTPINPDDQSWLTAKIPQALGSTVPFALGGGMARALGAAPSAAAGVLGAALNVDDIDQEARRLGVDPQRRQYMLGLAAATGLTEVAGLGGMLDKFGMKQAFIHRLFDVLEEGGQEAVQGFLNNVNAKLVGAYDPERGLSRDVVEGAILGSIAGGVFQGASAAAERLQGRGGASGDPLAERLAAINPRFVAPAEADQSLFAPDAVPADAVAATRAKYLERERATPLTDIRRARNQQAAEALNEQLGQEVAGAGEIYRQLQGEQDAAERARIDQAEALNARLAGEVAAEGRKVEAANQKQQPAQPPETARGQVQRAERATSRTAQADQARTQSYETAINLAAESGVRAESFASAGRLPEAIAELQSQQVALQSALRSLPNTPEALSAKTALARQASLGNQRLNDLRRAARQTGARDQSAPISTRSDRAESPLLNSIVNPGGGIPDTDLPTSSGRAIFERLTEGQKDRSEESPNLLTEVRRMGGIRDDGDTSGELRRLGMKEAGTSGLVNRNSRYSVDEMREMMVSEGMSRAETVADFYEELEEALRTSRRRGNQQTEEDYYESVATRGRDVSPDYRGDVGAPAAESLPRQSADLGRVEDSAPPARMYSPGAPEFLAELEPEERASLERALAESRSSNPRAYGDRTRPGEPGSGGVSFSPYNVLVANNRADVDRLFGMNLNAPDAREVISRLRDYSIKQGIGLHHLRNLLNYVRNDQLKKAQDKDRDALMAEMMVAGAFDEQEAVRDLEQRIEAEVAEIRRDLRALPRTEADRFEMAVEAIADLRSVMQEDPDMLDLYDAAIRGTDQNYQEFLKYAGLRYGFADETARGAIDGARREYQSRQSDQGARSGAADVDRSARANQAAEGGAGEAELEPIDRRTLDLIEQDPRSVGDRDYDEYLSALEDVRNRDTRGMIFLPPALLEQLRIQLSAANEERKLRVKAKRLPARFKVDAPAKPSKKELARRMVGGRPETEEPARITNETTPETQTEGLIRNTSDDREVLAHENPAIDGKPIIATTSDGRVIVENPDNALGVSIVKPQAAQATEPQAPADVAGVIRSIKQPGALVAITSLRERGVSDADILAAHERGEISLSRGEKLTNRPGELLDDGQGNVYIGAAVRAEAPALFTQQAEAEQQSAASPVAQEASAAESRDETPARPAPMAPARYKSEKSHFWGDWGARATSDGETITVTYSYKGKEYPYTFPIDERQGTGSFATQIVEKSGVPTGRIKKGSTNWDYLRNLGLDASYEIARQIEAEGVRAKAPAAEEQAPERAATPLRAGDIFEYQGKRFKVRIGDGGTVGLTEVVNDAGDTRQTGPGWRTAEEFTRATGREVVIESPRLREAAAKAAKVKYTSARTAAAQRFGLNGKEYIDNAIKSGYTVFQAYTDVNGRVKYSLWSPSTGYEIPLAGDTRKYAEVAASRTIRTSADNPAPELIPQYVTHSEIGAGQPLKVVERWMEQSRTGFADRMAVEMPDGRTKALTAEEAARTKPAEAEERAPEQPATPPAFGAQNTIFTEDRANAAREKLRQKLRDLNRQTNAGAPIDPELIQAGIDLAGYYIEAGARSFAAYSEKMISDLGEAIRPFLKSWYLAVRNYPGFDKAGMQTEAELDEEPKVAPAADKLPSKALEGMAQREQNAVEGMIESIMTLGEMDRDAALRVYDRYKRDKLFDNKDVFVGGQMRVKRGDLLDRDVLRRAAGLEEAQAAAEEPAPAESAPKQPRPTLRDVLMEAEYQGSRLQRAREQDEIDGYVKGLRDLYAQSPEYASNITAAITPWLGAKRVAEIRDEKPIAPAAEKRDDAIEGTGDGRTITTKSGGSLFDVDRPPSDAGGTQPEDRGDQSGLPADDQSGLRSDGGVTDGARNEPPAGSGRPKPRAASEASTTQGSRQSKPRSPRKTAKPPTKTELLNLAEQSTENMATAETVLEAVAESLAPEPDPQPETVEQPQPEPAPKPTRTVKPSQQLATLTGESFTITPEVIEKIQSGGQMTKLRQNMAAIRTLRQVLTDGRRPTQEEQEVMALYAGFGGIKNVFNPWDYSENLSHSDRQKWVKAGEELEELIGEEAFTSARKSIQNAHYTDPRIVQSMWAMAERLGFKGGRVLEPSMGSGNFLGLVPASLRPKTSFTGVELDLTTGEIARNLYPDANIKIEGFEDVKTPDDFYDLAIGNVPFGDYRISDPRYDRFAPQVHNYFFLKALDKVRPGGLVMFITSTGTLDSGRAQKIREALYEKADLVEALRFPAETFSKTALTSVVTDLIILRKRLPGEAKGDNAWVNTGEVKNPTVGARPIKVNEYLSTHRGKMLGEFNGNNKMYPGRANVDRTDDFEQRFAEAIANLPTDVMSERSAGVQKEVKEAGKGVKAGAFVVTDGKLYQNQQNALVEIDAKPERIKKVERMLAIRDSLGALIDAEMGRTDENTARLRRELNEAYDKFVGVYGALSEKKNRDDLEGDPELPRLLALESYDQKTKRATKQPIFQKSTVVGVAADFKPTNLTDAVLKSFKTRGEIVLPMIAEDLGLSQEAVAADLVGQGIAFQTPAGNWEIAAAYLSGNVRRKLAEAQIAAETDPFFEANVEALKAVMPRDLSRKEISVEIGAPWIPPADTAQFIRELFSDDEGSVRVHYDRATGAYHVAFDGRARAQHSREATHTWGTERVPFNELIDLALAGRSPQVYDEVKEPLGGTKRIFNAVETQKAAGKLDAIKQRFREWVWEDDARRSRLEKSYNEMFNSMRAADYDASFLGDQLPGMNPEFRLRPHQMGAVLRAVIERRGLMAHEVGLGKTLAMIASASELKRMGIARKPAIAVPKKVLPGFVQTAQEAYPHMKIQVIDGRDAEKRQRTMAEVATGEADLVLMTHDNLDMLKMRPEFEAEMLQIELDEVNAVYEMLQADARRTGASKGGPDGRILKQIEKRRDRLAAKINDALKAERKDDAITFEDTGIDFLFVDEFHKYKSLPVITALGSVKGVPTGDSQRAVNMLMRARYLQRLQNGGGLIGATGTPVSNSLVEAWIMAKFLQPDVLESAGVGAFDAWARNFAAVVPALELDATGRWKPTSRMSKFRNLPELQTLSRVTLDVKTAAATGILQKRPKRIDKVISVPMSEEQRLFMQVLRERAERVKSGKVEPTEDNYLVISSDGRQMAADMRLVMPGLENQPGGKVEALVSEVLRIHKEKPGSTQMIFSDIGVQANAWGFSLYEEIAKRLADGGIPRDKIINFSKLDSDVKVEKAVDRLNSGDAIIAIGHRENMGTGVNAQRKMAAVHQFDVPWKPALIEQSEARGWRQGNENSNIEILSYVVEDSFDAVMWSAVARKQQGIAAFMSGQDIGRELEDSDDESLSYEQIAATASGDQDYLRRAELQAKTFKLEMMERAHESERTNREREIPLIEQRIERYERTAKQIDKVQAAAQGVKEREWEFTDTTGGRYEKAEKAAAAKALMTEFLFLKQGKVKKQIGTYKGLPVFTHGHEDMFMVLDAGGGLTESILVNPNLTEFVNTFLSMDRMIDSLASGKEAARIREESIPAAQTDLERLRAVKQAPFPYGEQLAKARRQLEAVNKRLAAKEEGTEDKQKPLVPDKNDIDVRQASGLGRKVRRAVRDKLIKPADVAGRLEREIEDIRVSARVQRAEYREYQRKKFEDYLAEHGVEEASMRSIAGGVRRAQDAYDPELADEPKPAASHYMGSGFGSLQELYERYEAQFKAKRQASKAARSAKPTAPVNPNPGRAQAINPYSSLRAISPAMMRAGGKVPTKGEFAKSANPLADRLRRSVESKVKAETAPKKKAQPLGLKVPSERLRELVEEYKSNPDDRERIADELLAEYQRETAVGKPRKVLNTAIAAAGLPRQIMASLDASAPLRQGAILTLPPQQWPAAWRAWWRMWRAFRTSAYDQIAEEINNHPDADIAKSAGLYLATDEAHEADDLTKREEDWVSPWASKIPGVKHSEQAYKTYLDSIRMDTFARYKRLGDRMGYSPAETQKYLRAAAEWINIATGRGSLGATFDKAAPLLSAIFFAPRYTASRIQILNPWTYAKNLGTPEGRLVAAQQIGDLAGFAGVVAVTLGLLTMAGGTVGLDADEPDFLKLRFGNTRFDGLAGLQQVMRLFYRTGKDLALAAQGKKAEGQSAFDIVSRFGRSKLAPVPSYFTDLILRKDFIGRDFRPGDAAVERILPLMWKDFAEAVARDGWASGSKHLIGGFGIGVQDYNEKPGVIRDDRSRSVGRELRKHGLNYSEIDPLDKFEPQEAHNARAKKIEDWMAKFGEKLVDHPRYAKMTPAQQKAALRNLRGRIGEEANQGRPNINRFDPGVIVESVIKADQAKPMRDRGKIYVPRAQG